MGNGLVAPPNTIRAKAQSKRAIPSVRMSLIAGTEWDGFVIDTFAGLGSHTFGGGGTPTPTPTATPTPTPTPTPSTNPAGSGTANPASVAANGSTLLTVNVTPGTNPPSTGISVTGDLSSMAARRRSSHNTRQQFQFRRR